MNWSSLFILFFISFIFLVCYLLLGLNESVINIDLLFYEVQLKTGLALLIFFLSGLFVAILLELVFFLAKKRKVSE